MLNKVFKKIFGSKQEREVKKLSPILKQVDSFYKNLESLTDEELRAKTEEFKKRHHEGETLDDLMPEAFAVVKDACRRMVGREWLIDGRMQKWEMIPYDVQILGGAVLAQGKIAEMATGEGKTLVALFPTYLNALSGKGVHIVTVNDYLAKRDHDWMGHVLEFLGVSVGVITNTLKDSTLRRAEYAKDVTYGVNHEFGFDYLRDNMVPDVKDMVQRGFNYCLIDEVDSVLIDDARIPLIISGAVERATEQKYNQLKPIVFSLVNKQAELVNKLVAEAKNLLNEDKKREAYFKLVQCYKALPKHKALMELLNEQGVKNGVQKLENEFLRDKRMGEITDNLYYTIEEKSHVVDLHTKGHLYLTGDSEDKNMFILPDLGSEIHEIEKMEVSKAEKEEAKEKLHREYSDKSDKIHTIHQLLRAYCLYEKDVEYVVQDEKVIIVDQSTGRLKHDSRFSDGMHQAIEAKEGVAVGEETQTVATITYQNYFRMYKKLSGMTGTAITEENEFYEIYKLPVVEIPTNVPVIRDDQEDLIYKTRAEKYRAVVEQVKELVAQGRPVLIGTPDVDVSEVMHHLLKKEGIAHNLLNAKNHFKEAEIVKEAGQRGNVTIATNMAGRGTDIKLGEGVREKGGLAILGVERHSSRRIDRQLRGRAGRQGDPGSSRFYVSLEDNLMRIFGSERIASVMDKFGHEEGEPITHPWITKSIERAQKRVESHNFGMRKNVLEYDDVMNQKRNVIYTRRKKALIKGAISEGIEVPFAAEYGIDANESLEKDVLEIIDDYVDELIYNATAHSDAPEDWNYEFLKNNLMATMMIDIDFNYENFSSPKELKEYALAEVMKRYNYKKEIISAPLMLFLSKIGILNTVDRKWQEHLNEDEELRKGIGLMSHAQKDPLLEYKRRSFESFKKLVFDINQEAIEFIFKVNVKVQQKREEEYEDKQNKKLNSLKVKDEATEEKQNKPIRKVAKVGRNDSCPCGSGLKYKNCCGKNINN